MVIELAMLAMLAGVYVLITLAVIDWREWILPNEWVMALGVCGLSFHVATNFQLLDPPELIYGALAGGGVLWLIRFISNRVYGREALGLGDVKLMAAAGLWLGPYYTMIAMSAGAAAGMAIGLLFLALPHTVPDDIRHDGDDRLSQAAVPAGPGFCVGVAGVFAYMLYDWPATWRFADTILGWAL